MKFSLPLGICLLCLSLWGIHQGIKAGRAQTIYHHTKFGILSGSPPAETSRLSAEAFELYPHNYHFCLSTALKSYENLHDDHGKIIPEHMDILDEWCSKGLAINPYMAELNVLKAEIIATESLPGAIDYWKKYLDWHFWDPYNHAVLLNFYARSGDFPAALAEMSWVKGSAYHEDAKTRLQNAWQREIQGN